jgi:hypothetical protein
MELWKWTPKTLEPLCSKGFPLFYHSPIPLRYSIDIGSGKREEKRRKERRKKMYGRVKGGFADLKLFFNAF